MTIDSYGLEAFLAVARYGTLSRAADRLKISQSALSQRIKLIEESLKLTIIDRGRGRSSVSLTPAGLNLLPLAERWGMLRAELDTAVLGGLLSINVGASASVSDFVLRPLFSAINAQGQLRVNVHTANSPDLYERLERRELDIAFVLHSQRVSDASIVPLLSEKLAVVSKVALPLRGGLLDTERLDPRRQIRLRYGADYETWHVAAFGPLRGDAVVLNNIHLIGAFLHAEGSWAIVPTSVAVHVRDRGEANVFMLRSPPPDRVLYKIRRRTLDSQSEDGCRMLERLLLQIPLDPWIKRLRGADPDKAAAEPGADRSKA